MPRKTPMVLHRTEWERLKSQAAPPQKTSVTEKKDLKKLTENSQECMNKLPDTAQDHTQQLKKQKEDNHTKAIAEMKASVRSRKENASKVIAKAKHAIFEDSCYGKQLLSALAFSKTQEEREAQIKFKRELKNRELSMESASNDLIFNFKEREEEDERLRKARNLEIALINKSMYEMQKSKHEADRKEEARLELEDARLMQLLLDCEKEEEEHKRKCHADQMKEHKQEEQRIKEAEIRRDLENDVKTEILRKTNERKLMKIQETHKQIYKEKKNALRSRLNYEIFEEMEKEQQKRYDEFIEKGIQKLKDETLKKEQDDLLKQKLDHQERLLVNKYNRVMTDRTERGRRECQLTSDRQCLITTCHKNKKTKEQAKILKINAGKDRDKKPEFLRQSKNLMENLKCREEEPTPWNGLASMHAQFAKEAGDILAECQYKNEARRVVDLTCRCCQGFLLRQQGIYNSDAAMSLLLDHLTQ